MVKMASLAGQNGWLAVPRPNPQARLRLFCFPYSGASASAYYRWADGLPAALEVCPVQLPGRGTRLSEPPYNRLDDMVPPVAEALLPYLDRPFALFGHSMGALLGFEVARHLRRHYDLLPAKLVVSGHAGPQLPDRNPPLHALPEPEFRERLRELNGTPPEVLAHPELMQLLVPILRADFAASETYVYRAEEPLDCAIAAYGGLADPHVDRAELEAWQEQTTGPFSLRMLPGDHFYLNTHQALLLQSLAREFAGFANAP
jgi:medium-chain acyl-[acyl-carrier-protein] hydrolase